ncbi:MAG TPA: SRPBCC family protein [Streptosporangiaceae bacterium]|jgi:hypothetical protein
MASESRYLAERIDRPVGQVYEYAADPAHLPEWAPGLGSSVEQVDGQWLVQTPAGRARIDFVSPNDLGVLDQYVTPPSGETVYVPLRVIADGDGCEVVFTLRRQPGMTDAELDRDEAAVTADLARLKQVLEARP